MTQGLRPKNLAGLDRNKCREFYWGYNLKQSGNEK